MHRIAILGGGFGGGAAAISLVASGAPVSVTVIDRASVTYLGAEFPFVAVGERTAADASRTAGPLLEAGARFVRGDIQEIDLEAKEVRTSAGTIEYDSLVVALGTEYDWTRPAGVDSAESFYDVAAAERLRRRLDTFDGGRIVISVAGPPIKCPPGPFEAAMVLDWWLRRREVRDRSEIVVTFPEPAPLAVAGPEAATTIGRHLTDKRIRLVPGVTLSSIQGSVVTLSDGSTLTADLPIVVPLHRAPRVVVAAGLTGRSGWVDIDPATLETDVDGVFAIGDVNRIPVGGRALPKAGVFAAGEGAAVAATIASRVAGTRPPPPYDGAGHCFIAFSGTEGAHVGGVFLAAGGPQITLGEPGRAGMIAKKRFAERWRSFAL